ncbi:hypothetical protein ACFL3Q_15655 [Planctomycetota bacterium]
MNKQLFSTQALSQQIDAGPLVPYLDAFTNILSGQGYAKSTTKRKIRVIFEFNQWLQKRHLAIDELNESCINKFICYRKKKLLTLAPWRAINPQAICQFSSR